MHGLQFSKADPSTSVLPSPEAFLLFWAYTSLQGKGLPALWVRPAQRFAESLNASNILPITFTLEMYAYAYFLLAEDLPFLVHLRSR